jgi:hypothetical protein
MATEWGDHTIGPRQTQGWFFARPTQNGFLPVLSVRPLSPSFTASNQWHLHTDLTWISFPFVQQLGVSTIWSQLSNDQRTTTYFMLVMNYSDSTVAYSFVEADL